MKNLYKPLLVASLVGLWSGTGLAEPDASPGTPWSKLAPEQRELLLKTHEERWNSLSAEKQQRMLRGAERWQKMSPQERKRIESRRDRFMSMAPEERDQMRERHRERREAFAKLPPEKQQAIRDCKKRRHAGEDVDCRSLWPDAPGRHDEGPVEPKG
jgi:hypothetical protein